MANILAAYKLYTPSFITYILSFIFITSLLSLCVPYFNLQVKNH